MLYKRPDSQFWWIQFISPDGKKIRRSTNTLNRRDAEAYEAKVKTEVWRQAQMGERPRYTWIQAVTRWLEETSYKASHKDDLTHAKYLSKYLDTLYLDQIDSELVDTIRSQRRKEVTNASTNRLLAVLRAVLRRAMREWNWVERIPAIRLLPEPRRRVRWLTQAEAQRLIAELPQHLALLVRFSLATGLRETNVTLLEWGQVDLDRRVAWIHPDQAKSRKAICVPLNDTALDVLNTCQGQHPVRVFTIQGRPIKRAAKTAWRSALVRAGITNFRWHDLRHTWASWHVQAGTPMHILQELGGWESEEMVRKYAHLTPAHLAAYVLKNTL